MPDYLVLQGNIERWGAAGVLGGPLGIDEIANILGAEVVVHGYQERQAAENMAEWNKQNPDKASLIAQAKVAAKELNGWQQK